MNTIAPDGWVIIKIHHKDEIIYKVYGSWNGGYVHGDSWRLNSGIKSVEQDGDYIRFHGFSGSVYECHTYSEGKLTGYTNSNLGQIIHTLNHRLGVLIEVITFQDYLKENSL